MENRVTTLFGIEKPVFMAGMVYICDSTLAAAVANAGGLGLLGISSNVDKPEPDPVKTGENFRSEIRRFRELAPGKPLAVNYIPSIPTFEAKLNYSDVILKVMLEEKVEVAQITSQIDLFDIKRDIETFKNAGIKVMYRELRPTVESCKKAAEYGADAIIVTGCEAGGHIPGNNMSLMSILPQVREALPDFPIIAAGGMIDERSAKAAALLGADGAYVGTALMIAEECRTHPNYKKVICETKGEDLITWASSAPNTKMVTTANRNGLVCESLSHAKIDTTILSTYYNGTWDKSLLQGDVENGCVTFNSSVGALTTVKPAKEFVDDIAKGFGF
ncbi:NAD(P)H-dependent flavin oxidoreductase [Clostridium estertheticum]|uniref:NAD(P)H-dependent flavin oxidoreductase n=1 Tax=Clostridium estertheticum TaxID=238834 RepID=UPI001CF0DA0F|nr:nitronate monooxygenase [Clostridium estertheticum]MCB2354185.1 nitronate monooxygenase [Clostridium estertheticum]WAG43316.1 nitronate monooxygenase [Clostridium estertheticum]